MLRRKCMYNPSYNGLSNADPLMLLPSYDLALALISLMEPSHKGGIDLSKSWLRRTIKL